MKVLYWSVLQFALMDSDAAATWPALRSAEATVDDSGDGKTHQVLQYYDQFRESIYRYLLSLRLAPEAAEDLVHETFLRLHRALADKRVRTESVRAWVFRVAHNLAISSKRKASEIALDNDELTCLSDLRQSSPDPETAALQHEWLQLNTFCPFEIPRFATCWHPLVLGPR
jgi:DNA-directed RNA polymerase specialized sigma24 family protein